jgi:hypothetical protein
MAKLTEKIVTVIFTTVNGSEERTPEVQHGRPRRAVGWERDCHNTAHLPGSGLLLVQSGLFEVQ